MIYNSSKEYLSVTIAKSAKYYKASLNLICSVEITHKYILCMKGINSEGDYIRTL